MFEDIESDSDDGSLGSLEDEIVGRLDVEPRSLSPEKERKPEGGASDKKDDGQNVVVL